VAGQRGVAIDPARINASVRATLSFHRRCFIRLNGNRAAVGADRAGGTFGWSVRTLPIADSEEGREQTKKVLRYDDVIYRTYQRGAIEVQIYALLHPGSVPYGQAGVHYTGYVLDCQWVDATRTAA